jgi:hypothetical protein
VRRLFEVLERQLTSNEYMAGGTRHAAQCVATGFFSAAAGFRLSSFARWIT